MAAGDGVERGSVKTLKSEVRQVCGIFFKFKAAFS